MGMNGEMPSNFVIEKRYFSITEVADLLGVNPSMLRYWEKEFRQLHPRTNARGKRFYTERDIELIRRIHELVKVRAYTIEGARRLLNGEIPEDVEGGQSEPLRVADGGAEQAERLQSIEELNAVRERLEGIRTVLLDWRDQLSPRGGS
jgi:DNA-binding transcriptional MerR regulator